MEELSANKAFGGWNRRYKHDSKECGCSMTFTIYMPEDRGAAVPAVYFLSGLTCTDENFIQKAGAQRMAAKLGLALIAPDTSPRGLGIKGEDESWDFGTGAGFYVDATEPKWRANYRMYSYITRELPALLKANVPALDTSNVGIMGHSMGGHGALSIALKNPGVYKSASAFSPICNPINCPWGQKAFSGYLGADEEAWKAYDSSELLRVYSGPSLPVLVDTGTGDNFYKNGQLLPESLKVEGSSPVTLTNRLQDDYDHSYFFIATFMEEHLLHHAAALGCA